MAGVRPRQGAEEEEEVVEEEEEEEEDAASVDSFMRSEPFQALEPPARRRARRRRTVDREDRERLWQEIGIKIQPELVGMLGHEEDDRRHAHRATSAEASAPAAAARAAADGDGGGDGGGDGKTPRRKKRKPLAQALFSERTGERLNATKRQREHLMQGPGMANAALVAGIKEAWREYANERRRDGLGGSLNESGMIATAILMDELLEHELEREPDRVGADDVEES